MDLLVKMLKKDGDVYIASAFALRLSGVLGSSWGLFGSLGV